MEQLKMTMTTWANRKLIVNDYVETDEVRIEILDGQGRESLATWLTHAQVRDLIKFLQEIENNS